MTAPAPSELAAYTTATRNRRRVLVLWAAAIAAVAVIAIPLAVTLARGPESYEMLNRSYPGQFTAVMAAVLRAVVDAASVVAVGALVVVMFLLARPGKNRAVVDGEPETRIVFWAALVWGIGAGLLVLVDAADANGVPLTRLLEPGALAYLVEAAYLPKAWTVVMVLALIASFVSVFAHKWADLLLPLWCSAIAILAPVVVGQVQVGIDHDLGTDAAIVLTLATSVLFGTLIVLGVRVARGFLLRPDTLRRTLNAALVCWAAAVFAQGVVVWFKLGKSSPADNPTALIEGVRCGALLFAGVVLLAAVLRARRGTLTDRRLARLLAAGILLAGAYLGAGVAATRVPPPQYFLPTTIMQNYFGFDVTPAPTLEVLATHWRLNLGFALIAAAGVAVYLAGVVRLRRRGDAWPLGRTISWCLGWVAVVVATSSGVGRYSGSSFAVHMGVHMGLNMLAPILLVMGGVITLFLRATTPRRAALPAGPHEWLSWAMHWRGMRILYNPLVVFVLFVGSYYGLYLTGIFEEAMRSHWAHQAMNLHFLIAGYLFYGLVIGVDRPPKPLPPIGKLGFVLAAMPFHAFFGIIMMTTTTPVAENLYTMIDAPWAGDLLDIQYLGGGIAWGGGELPLMIVVVALGIQWARQDRREARRKDRHMDAGLDDEFDAYNEMLEKLARRSQTPAPQPVNQEVRR